jgi:bifunctional DNA-binding transcriptional regulator/antitoxin component of YhaV-PrlF toxin-antitoxin module
MRLSKTGKIHIPISVRKEIDLEIGDLINIILDGERIVLTSKEGYEKENKCLISENGTIHIPTEIRRLSNISFGAVFRVLLDNKEKRITLIPDIERVLQR